jgi:hypothetical protein
MKPAMTAAAAVLLLLAAAVPAAATTYVPMSDSSLADQAAAVARVRVVQAEPGPANRVPAIDYLVEVDDVVQGYLPGSTIVVRVPGGVRADGVGLRIWGAPAFQAGEEALLFLTPGADGTFGIVHLMLGAFHARTAGGVALAEQDLADAHRLGAGGVDKAVRDLDRFAAWLADRAAGLERDPDYWIEPPAAGLRRAEKSYTLLPTPDNVPTRWFAFDSGKSVGWSVHSGGQPGLDLGQTEARFQAALAAWNADPTSSIHYAYSGLTGAAAGLGTSDRVNAILFNDPNGQVPGSFDCKKGGVVAIGGAYFYASTQSFRGQSFHDSFEADVVTNDGTECFFHDNPSVAEEVFAHELGHTLGFGHASEAQALMWAKAHNDGRGARLGDDDRIGASMLYGDGSYQPPPPPPPASLKASATASRTEIEFSWSGSWAGSESFRVELQKKKGVFETLQTVAAESTAVTLAGLKPNKVYCLRVSALSPDGAVTGSSNVVKVRTRK